VQHVPEEALRAQKTAATDPLMQSMAGLMLYCARGDVIDTTEASNVLATQPQRSVSRYLQETLGK
jgi:hypothetical protein